MASAVASQVIGMVCCAVVTRRDELGKLELNVVEERERECLWQGVK